MSVAGGVYNPVWRDNIDPAGRRRCLAAMVRCKHQPVLDLLAQPGHRAGRKHLGFYPPTDIAGQQNIRAAVRMEHPDNTGSIVSGPVRLGLPELEHHPTPTERL